MLERLTNRMTFRERVTFTELIKNKGQAVTRQRLAEVALMKNFNPAFDRSVDIRVSRIRKHLVNNDSNHKILPVWGKGYVLIDGDSAGEKNLLAAS